MKIAIISDLHLGFRQYGSMEREEDFYNQFLKVCTEISKYEPNMVIIAGDLFNKPNPTPIAINAYREGIGELGADIICTIKGNHTMILRDSHYSIDDFFGSDEFEGYYYLDDSSMTTKEFSLSEGDYIFREYKDTNVRVTGITYRSNSNIDEFISLQKEMAEKLDDDMYNILVVHQSFKEFCGFTGEELSIEDIDYSPYNAIVCGHIHSRYDTRLSDGTWFIQPGSIERMNTTEAKDEIKNGKGFYLLDTDDDSLEFHQVESLRKFFMGDIRLETEDDLKNHMEELNKDVKKLEVPPIISYNYISSIKNIEEVREKIGAVEKEVLLNKSNIDDWSQEEVSIDILENELPTIKEAIIMYGEKTELSKQEAILCSDVYDALINNIDSIQGLLDNYFEKKKKRRKNIDSRIDPELKELMEYFEE